jgi:hypothetical protein
VRFPVIFSNFVVFSDMYRLPHSASTDRTRHLPTKIRESMSPYDSLSSLLRHKSRSE